MPDPAAELSVAPRRAFLQLAVLAPLAAGCATVRPGPAPAVPAAVPAPSPAAPDPLEALRAFPLPDEAEPAFVFRALLAPVQAVP